MIVQTSSKLFFVRLVSCNMWIESALPRHSLTSLCSPKHNALGTCSGSPILSGLAGIFSLLHRSASVFYEKALPDHERAAAASAARYQALAEWYARKATSGE